MTIRTKEHLKNAVLKYKQKVQKIKKSLIVAIRNYKQAVDRERMEHAKKRMG